MTLIKSLIVLVLVAALAAVATFWLIKLTTTQPVAEGDGVLRTEQEFRDELASLRMDRGRVEKGIKRLEAKKQETMDFLVNEKGIKSSDDITDDTDVRFALRELKSWKSEIANLESDLPKYDDAISSIQAMLSELERQRIHDDVALTEDQYIKLRKVVVDLRERLEMDKADPLEDEELYNMFDEEVGAEDKPAGEPVGEGS